jgi:aminoglycoside phosphotransferase (APT) family kinase protein
MFPRSVAMMRAAKPTVRVPEVLFADCSRARFEVPVMVLERVPGTTLKRLWPTLSAGERLDLIADVASQLGRLHAIDPTDVLGAGFTTPWWRERVSRIERLLAELRPHPDFPAAWFDTMARYVDEHRDALTSSPAAAPLHNDVNFGNVLARSVVTLAREYTQPHLQTGPRTSPRISNTAPTLHETAAAALPLPDPLSDFPLHFA